MMHDPTTKISYNVSQKDKKREQERRYGEFSPWGTNYEWHAYKILPYCLFHLIFGQEVVFVGIRRLD